MSRLSFLCIMFTIEIGCAQAAMPSQLETEESVENKECHEGKAAQLEMLQLRKKEINTTEEEHEHVLGGLTAQGGDHRYMLVRPCARLAGDGMSGLPRLRVTGECCGDSACSSGKFETAENCPQDCTEVSTQEKPGGVFIPPTESRLFGTLEGMEHDQYHCNDDDGYEVSCSKARNYSAWLEDLMDRSKAGTLPFELPAPGSTAVEFGCGLGQDTRNMAGLAGWAVTAIDVSPAAIEIAKNTTSAEMLGTGPGQIEFVAYDSMALPFPKQRVDFFFDATVYCSLRHEHLARLYEVWARILTPGHTVALIQCWNWEYQPEGWARSFASELSEQPGQDSDSADIEEFGPVPRSQHDMELDFEPFFETLHSEKCEKNQDGPGWCFYLKLKAPEVRKLVSEDRLKMQVAARNGDIEAVRKSMQDGSRDVTAAELKTLYYIARANQRVPLMNYLKSAIPEEDDPFREIVYGRSSDAMTIEMDDEVDGSDGVFARMESSYLRADWERAEAELILQTKNDRLKMSA